MRLLFLIKSLAVTGGGAERVLSQVTSVLAQRGHDVTVATFDQPQSSDFYPVDRLVTRERLGIGQLGSRSGVIEFGRQVGAVRRCLSRCRPDVAVGFMHSTYIPLAIGSVGLGIPLIASEHAPMDHFHGYRAQFALIRLSAPRFSALTVPSERVRSGYPPAVASRMEVVPNPVAFPAALQTRTNRKSNRVLLSVGGLRVEKGHSVLVAAFAAIADRFPDWTLRLVGDGPCRAELERQVAELGIRPRVRFIGAVADVAPEYAAADLLAAPSSYESFGLATAEALASGVPAVGFADCPGTNEIIQSRVNGLLVEGNDRVTALASGLSTLMADDEMRGAMAVAAPSTVAGYSLESVADRWEEVIANARRRAGNSA